MAALRIKREPDQHQPPSTPELTAHQEALLNSSFEFDGGEAYKKVDKLLQASQWKSKETTEDPWILSV